MTRTSWPLEVWTTYHLALGPSVAEMIIWPGIFFFPTPLSATWFVSSFILDMCVLFNYSRQNLGKEKIQAAYIATQDD